LRRLAQLFRHGPLPIAIQQALNTKLKPSRIATALSSHIPLYEPAHFAGYSERSINATAESKQAITRMNSNPENDFTSTGHAPLREQRASIIFMMFLLIISGLTASIVGYRVKSADLDRKAQLLKTYQSYGGSFELAHTLGATLVAPTRSNEQNTFIAAYEVNCRARALGLYRVLETTPKEAFSQIIQSLFTIEATEAARSTEDAWRAYQEPQSTENISQRNSPANTSSKAIRFAKQYDRNMARDTEVKLFRYSRQLNLNSAVKEDENSAGTQKHKVF
jgi:hypothetical protein